MIRGQAVHQGLAMVPSAAAPLEVSDRSMCRAETEGFRCTGIGGLANDPSAQRFVELQSVRSTGRSDESWLRLEMSADAGSSHEGADRLGSADAPTWDDSSPPVAAPDIPSRAEGEFGHDGGSGAKSIEPLAIPNGSVLLLEANTSGYCAGGYWAVLRAEQGEQAVADLYRQVIGDNVDYINRYNGPDGEPITVVDASRAEMDPAPYTFTTNEESTGGGTIVEVQACPDRDG